MKIENRKENRAQTWFVATSVQQRIHRVFKHSAIFVHVNVTHAMNRKKSHSRKNHPFPQLHHSCFQNKACLDLSCCHEKETKQQTVCKSTELFL